MQGDKKFIFESLFYKINIKLNNIVVLPKHNAHTIYLFIFCLILIFFLLLNNNNKILVLFIINLNLNLLIIKISVNLIIYINTEKFIIIIQSNPMKKIKNVPLGYGTQKSSLPSSNVNVKDKFSVVLGDKKREAENLLKAKKDENNQLLSQLQSLNEKFSELISKRNKLLTNINQQKSQIFLLKNKNKAFRNYLNELTAKDSNEIDKNKKKEED